MINEISNITYSSSISDYFGFKDALETLGFDLLGNNGSDKCYFGHTGDVNYFSIANNWQFAWAGAGASGNIKGLSTTQSVKILYKKNSLGDVLFGFYNSSIGNNIPVNIFSISSKKVTDNSDTFMYGSISSATSCAHYLNTNDTAGLLNQWSSTQISEYMRVLQPYVLGDSVATKAYISYTYRTGEQYANYTEFEMNGKNYIASAYGRIVIELS